MVPVFVVSGVLQSAKAAAENSGPEQPVISGQRPSLPENCQILSLLHWRSRQAEGARERREWQVRKVPGRRLPHHRISEARGGVRSPASCGLAMKSCACRAPAANARACWNSYSTVRSTDGSAQARFRRRGHAEKCLDKCCDMRSEQSPNPQWHRPLKGNWTWLA